MTSSQQNNHQEELNEDKEINNIIEETKQIYQEIQNSSAETDKRISELSKGVNKAINEIDQYCTELEESEIIAEKKIDELIADQLQEIRE